MLISERARARAATVDSLGVLAAKTARRFVRAASAVSAVLALGTGCSRDPSVGPPQVDLGVDAGDVGFDAGVDLGVDAGVVPIDAGTDLGVDGGTIVPTCTPDFANDCGGAVTHTLTVGIGQTMAAQGTIDETGDDYFAVDFTGDLSTTVPFHPKVTMPINPGGAYSFEILTGCTTAALGCGAGLTTFEAVYPGTTHGCNASTCVDLDGRPTSYVVHVSRAGALAGCFTYQIQISNVP